MGGCARLRPWSPLFQDNAGLTSFGSQVPPVVVFDGPEKENTSVYVFDVNPLVACRTLLRGDAALRRGRDDSEPERVAVSNRDADALPHPDAAGPCTTAVVEDINEVLPGAVDSECAAIPYVAYRFPLPYSTRAGSPDAPEIGRTTMSMTGFTVRV